MSALNVFSDASFTSRLCLALLHSLWQIGFLAIALWVIDRFAGQRSVNARYKLHVAALLLALGTVPLTFLALDVPQELLAPTAVRSSAAETELAAQPLAPATTPAESQGHGQRAAEASPPPAVARPMPVHSTPVLPAASITRWIAVIYALGVLLMLARLLRGMWLGQRMISRAQALTDGPLVLATRRLAERWKLASLPRLAISDALSLPCVTGLLRPTIVFPLAALSGMSPAELELILAHELAHVRRHDLWIQLLQRLAEAVLFFNPGLWYLSRRLSILREYCCDELACGVPASSAESTRLQYAAALVHSAELQLARRGQVSGSSLAEIGALAATGSSPSELRRRVARILHEPVRDPVLLTRAQVVAFVALIAALAIAPAAVYSGNQDPNATLENKPADSSEKQPAAEPEGPAAQPDPFTRTLKSGAVVKVLGIGTRNEKPDRWWHPDGKPFEGAPYQVKDNDRYNFPGPVTREVVFAVEKVTPDATFRIETNPTATNWGNGGVADADGDRLAHHYGRIFSLAREVRAFELKVGVASGEWETVATCKPSRPSKAPVAANGVIFSGPYLSGDGQVVTVSHELQHQDTRLVVVTKDGKRIPVVNWYRESSGERLKLAQFEIRVPPEFIASFEFQSRDYEWADFGNLPVEPSPDAVAAISPNEKPAAATATDTEKKVPQVKVVAIGSLNPFPQRRWWDAQGNLLEDSFNIRGDSLRAENLKHLPEEQLKYLVNGRRVLVYKLPDLPADARLRYEIHTAHGGFKSEFRRSDSAMPLPDDQVPQFYEFFNVPPDEKTFKLRVGVAAGDWTTVYIADAAAQGQGTQDQKGIVLSGVFEKSGKAAVIASHNWHAWDTRVVAIDKSGQQHEPSKASHVTAADTVNQSTYEFKDVASADIKKLKFQTRAFDWTAIDNLPVEPKPDRNAKATISGRIVLADGTPAKTPGWLYYDLSNPGNSTIGTDDRYTDAFSISLRPGTVWLRYFADGYAPAWLGPFELQAGEHIEDVNFVLENGYQATLHIRDETGEAIPGVTVMRTPIIAGNANGPAVPLTADADGRLVLDHLASTPYDLTLTAPGYQPLRIKERTLQADESVPLVMKACRLASGVIRTTDGKTAAGAVLRFRVETAPGMIYFQNGQVMATADEQGRFVLNQLSDDTRALFLVETTDGAKLMVPDIVPGQANIEITVPPRRDFRVHLVGDLGRLPVRKGKPYIGLRQRYKFRPAGGNDAEDLIRSDAFVTPTPEGGIAEFKGLIQGDVALTTTGARTKSFELAEGQEELTVPVAELE